MHGMTFSNLTKTKRFGNAEKNLNLNKKKNLNQKKTKAKMIR